MQTEGALTIDGKKAKVRGLTWMDHEFGSNQLHEDQVGWDWFSIQLDNQTELMLYLMRRKDGSTDPYSSGTLVKADGTIVLAGYTYSNNSGDVEANHGAGDFWIIGLNGSGNATWKKALGGDNEELAYAIAESTDGFAVAGATMSKNSGDVDGGFGNSDVWVVKLKDE